LTLPSELHRSLFTGPLPSLHKGDETHHAPPGGSTGGAPLAANSHHVDFHEWAMAGIARPSTVAAVGSTGVARAKGIDTEDTITLPPRAPPPLRPRPGPPEVLGTEPFPILACGLGANTGSSGGRQSGGG